jgi:hypothetical protein
MRCIRKTVELPKKDSIIHMRPLGDIHLGNLGCDVDKYLKNVKFIADHADHITIGMGDYIDNVMAYANGSIDKRWNPETVDRQMLTTEEQVNFFVESWKPIADKTLGMHSGNHEWKTINQERFLKDFCDPLGLRNQYLGRLGYTSLTFTHKGKEIRNYLILSMHGGYSGLQAGGAVNRMKAITGDFDCDVVLMGHNHDTWVRPIIRTGYDRKHNVPVEKKVLMGNTGTFLRGYEKGIDSYVEINPKEAKRVGTITVTFDPYKGDLFGHD